MPAPLLVGVPRIPARLKGDVQADATQRRRSHGAGIGLWPIKPICLMFSSVRMTVSSSGLRQVAYSLESPPRCGHNRRINRLVGRSTGYFLPAPEFFRELPPFLAHPGSYAADVFQPPLRDRVDELPPFIRLH